MRLGPLRPLVRWLRGRLRLARLRYGVARLRRMSSSEELSLPLMEELERAWGNPGYSGDPGFLVTIARYAWNSPGPFLDCGSGLSTLVLAVVAERRGTVVFALEQDEGWHRDLGRDLARLGIGNVHLWYAPLRVFDSFVWYDLGGRALPAELPFVACDGPAVHRAPWTPELYQAWRVGAPIVLRQEGVGFGRIVLDDASDARAPGLVQRWKSLGLSVVEVETPTGRHLEATP
jgi:hypothetical protein